MLGWESSADAKQNWDQEYIPFDQAMKIIKEERI
jgi:hypothetical protein